MKITTFAALALSVALVAPAAHAEERFPAGGISIDPSAKVSIAKQDIYLSVRQVRVHYDYQSDVAQTVPMRFEGPIVPIDQSPDHLGGAMLEEGMPYQNYPQLKVTVDGKVIEPTIHEHAYYNGEDITKELGERGLPVYIGSWEELQAVWNGLDELQKGDVGELGFILLSADGQPSVANWQYQTVFEWEQPLAAGTTAVDIEYVPMNGYVSDVHPAYYGEVADDLGKSYTEEIASFYCIDDALAHALKTKREEGQFMELVELGYAMSREDRARAIGEFSLTVDKADPQTSDAMDYVAFCPLDSRKVSDTAFEWTAGDFTPSRDIDVVYYAFGG